MISKDLTCNETMPPLDDGDNKTMHRTRNGKPMAGRSSAAPKPSADFGSTDSLNHMTTVREVVTRHFRNTKFNATADSSLGYSAKLGGILSTIGGHFDVISHNTQQQQRHILLNNNQDSNGFMPTADYHLHHSALTPSVSKSVSHSSEDGYRHAHLSPSSTSSSTSTPPSSSANLMATKHQTNLDIRNNSLLSSNATLSAAASSSFSSSSLLHPFKSNNSPGYYVKTVSLDGDGTATFISPPLPTNTVIDQQQQSRQTGPTITAQQQPPQWAISPPVGHSIQKHFLHKSGGVVVPNRTASAVGLTSPPPQPINFETLAHHKQNDDHSLYASTVPSTAVSIAPPKCQSPSASIGTQKQQQQQHSSPRPGILRGTASAVRRLTVDRDRPASVSGLFACDNLGSTNGRLTNCASRGEGGAGAEESPRKRLRKQHFDNSQLVGDKLMVEVLPNDRLAQSASAGPSLTSCWRSSAAERGSAHQNCTTTGGGKSAAVLAAGKQQQQQLQPKKRGRPRMNCRTQQLPLVSPNATTKPTGNGGSKSQNVQQQNNNKCHPTEEGNGGRKQREWEYEQSVLGNHLLTQIDTTKTPKPIMFEMQPIPETGNGQQKRKYIKRTPAIDPSTGVQKVRKKGSGRKPKKDVVAESAPVPSQAEVATAKADSAFCTDARLVPSTSAKCFNHETTTNCASYCDGQQSVPIRPSEMMPKTAEEREVINTLCRFKRDKDSREMISHSAEIVGHSQKPSCSSSDGISKIDHHHPPLPLLADLKDLSTLRPLLRRCERGLNSTDNCHLSESYDEIVSFLRSFRRTTEIGQFGTEDDCELTVPKHLDEQCVSRLCAGVACSVFDSYDEFKNAINSLRLLPVACAYFDASHRLLSHFRAILKAVLLYHYSTEEAKLEPQLSSQEEIDRWFFGDGRKLVGIESAETEDDDDAEGEREEQTSRAFFMQLKKEYEKCFGNGRNCQKDVDGGEQSSSDSSQQKVAERLLLQLDVAQTLDLLLDCAGNGKNSNSQRRPVHSLTNCASEPCGMDSTTNANNSLPFCCCPNLPNELGQFVRTKRKIRGGLRTGKRKRSASECMLREEEELMEQQRQHDGGDNLVEEAMKTREQENSLAPLLKSIERLCVESLAENARLNDLAISVSQKTSNCGNGRNSFAAKASSSSDSILKCQSASDPATTKRKRNNNSLKAHQFALRPSGPMIDELFDCVPKIAASENGEEIVYQTKDKQQRKDHDAEMASKQQQEAEQSKAPKLLRADVEEMMVNCQWQSAMALAQLRHKHSKILTEEPSSSSSAIGDDCSPRPFVRALRFHFPSNSSRDKQSEFLEFRLRELNEICTTTMALSRTRAALAEQCAESICETLEEMKQQQWRAKQQLDAKAKSTTLALSRTTSMETTTFSPKTKLLGSVRLHSAKTMPKQQRRRVFSLEEEEQEDELMPLVADGRETPAEPQAPQGRQSPTKRAAHQRALTQMIISSAFDG